MYNDLAKFGAIGVAIAALILCGVAVNGLLTITGNHIDHNTEAVLRQTEVISSLETTIELNTALLSSFAQKCE